MVLFMARQCYTVQTHEPANSCLSFKKNVDDKNTERITSSRILISFIAFYEWKLIVN